MRLRLELITNLKMEKGDEQRGIELRMQAAHLKQKLRYSIARTTEMLALQEEADILAARKAIRSK